MDLRLLTLLAEMGRAAVHEVAARLGMDPREAASRLVALSANGLPLVVGVECDPNGIRGVLAAASPPGHPQQAQHPVQGTPSGVYPPSAYPQSAPQPSTYPPGTYPGQGHGYPMGPPSGANAYPTAHPQQAPHPVQGTPSGVYGTPSGVYPAAGTPSGAYPPPPPHQSGPYPVQQSTPSGAYPVHGTPSGRYQGAVQQPPSQPIPMQSPADPVMSTWGPPQSSSWARGDQPGGQGPAHAQQQPARPAAARKAKVGEKLETEGLEGEHLQIQLVELVDPADFLFTAAGYRLQEGERSVVVHTEMVNRGGVAFNSLPDLYLVLMTKDGQTVSKAPVSLSSRPPHRIGVAPGETAGGHTVYVLPENTEVTAIRWTARPDDTSRALTWEVVL
nr:hypothetical protein [Kibdelosporangium sp. MJ126-NF4]CTQ91853.1 hypothetical protein [Kibdelosporangium sp. MJ126-NF4]